MKRFNLLLMMAFVAIACSAQKPLELTEVVKAEGLTAQQLYEISKNWFARTYVDSKAVMRDDNPGKELTGKGKTKLEITTLAYSGMSGYINYTIDIQFREGRLKFTMNSFYHEPTKKVMYDNDMGAVLDSLPDNLKSLGGRFEKSSYRTYYKGFHKRALPVCKEAFDKLVTSLKQFVDKREVETKDEW
ncbi:MAG: DUF4468 domain-containing protein [Prevotella bivia]|jgi:hypothetical protein|nr:DUF4468 domain-containing protein [Prevotella bivia]